MNRWIPRWLAWGMVIASFPVWSGVFVAPFLPLPAEQRALVAALSVGLGEGLFWVGGALLGKEVLARLRKPKVNTGNSFAGRRALVLGASGGLGEAIARALHREGASVGLVVRDPVKVQVLATELAAPVLQADLTDAASLERAAASFGAFDLLINASGQDTRQSFASHTPEQLQRELAVNLAGPMLALRAFLPHLRERGVALLLGGFGDGRLAFPYYTADVAARAGLAAFSEALNRELALEGRDIVVSYLCPEPADTEAERPFTRLWQELGTKVVAPSAVADFVLQSALARRKVAIMGRATALLSMINALSPALADLLALRRIGRALREAFGRKALV
ncbi:SDR family NAD(P)-dependent oxidoreductase [Vitiosangium sp. GDMCC 1.1324]|uniref:SDR family NAD(P)-dependent oxidoreductase n=1 Tax=Vitiosangium sp. (strain GDMCC 1.1324) TaxID=2138576 RepID=UPI000D3396D0|nr:SDR family NAD(P)-dependent oxidoreductase [Vitiosangium sp. GDMCC 1.1324]PTL79241.1 oxidoreductase [Vitiosangium sp. GDMCC 1.1324]